MNADWQLPPLVKLLDPRPEALAERWPIRSAANIPADELILRLHELPPRDQVIELAAFRETQFAKFTAEAERILLAGARRCVLRSQEPAETFRHGRLWQPRPLLTAAVPHCTGNRALDLGCGAGREAVALASVGFQVTAVDRLPDALHRLRLLEGKWRTEQWGVIETLAKEWSEVEGEFDLVIAFSAFDTKLPDVILKCLAPNGVLALETFTTVDAEQRDLPMRSHYLSAEVIPALFPNVETIRFETDWDGPRHRAHYLGRRIGR